MKTMIRTCLLISVAGAAMTLVGCGDSGDVVDVTPRKHDANAPKIDPNAGPGEGFTPMEEEGSTTESGG